jgi:WhiB family redox-sensing transcriptional regulator
MTDAYVPLTGPPTWQHAACRGEDPEMWYPFSSSSPLLRNPDGQTAKDICRRCEHAIQCVAWAVHLDDHHGIWGGLDPEQRDPIWAQRQRRAEVEKERQERRLEAEEAQNWRQRALDDAVTGWS